MFWLTWSIQLCMHANYIDLSLYMHGKSIHALVLSKHIGFRTSRFVIFVFKPRETSKISLVLIVTVWFNTSPTGWLGCRVAATLLLCVQLSIKAFDKSGGGGTREREREFS